MSRAHSPPPSCNQPAGRQTLLVYIWGRKSSRERLLDPNPQTSCALYSQSKQKEAWPENGIMYYCLHSNFKTILVDVYNGFL